jgi:hypothetical protein
MGSTHLSGPLYVQGGIQDMGVRRGRAWYVDTTVGNGDGSDWDNAFNTMAAALSAVGSNDVIYFVGNVREQLTAPHGVFDVSIIGASNRPRNSDAHGTNISQRSTTWRGPASPASTTPLLTLRHQGWKLVNILFNPPSDAAAVKLQRNALSGDDEDDASHAMLLGCRFTGGLMGIEDVGGHYNVLVDDCFFNLHTASTGYAIRCTSTAVAAPLMWNIRNSRFMANGNHIVAAASRWMVHDNIFGATDVTTKIDFNGGVVGNIITRNYLGGTYSISGGYRGAGSGDEWAGNYNPVTAGQGITEADPA